MTSVSGPSAVQTAPGTTVALRILATTDLHAHLFPYDYYADMPSDSVGLALIGGLVAEARAETANCLLFDNGDFLQGNPLGDFVVEHRSVVRDEPHPAIAAMNALGYDAAALGNHEFNYGIDFLMSSLAGARFPVLAANVLTGAGTKAAPPATLLPPYAMLDRRLKDAEGNEWPIRVGVIGLLPPQIMVWDRDHLEGRLAALDVVEAARLWLPRMRREGADIVIALNHSGIGGTQHRRDMENTAIPLARDTDIDLQILGHSHLLFPSPAFQNHPEVDCAGGRVGGKPAVMAGACGSHLGVIDLDLRRGTEGWHIAGARSELRPVSGQMRRHSPVAARSIEAVMAAARTAHASTLAYVRRPVGRTSVALHTHFALLGDCDALRLINAAQRWHVERALAADGRLDLPVLSVSAPAKAGGRGGPQNYSYVAAGGVSIGNVADLYPFPNAIRALRLNGAEIRDWLERAAGAFCQVRPGAADQVLTDPDFPAYNFDVFAGLDYTVDVTRPRRFRPGGGLEDTDARRITDLHFAGRPVAEHDQFIVVTNSYRAWGGGDYPPADPARIVLESPATNRDILLRYIRAGETVPPPAYGSWRLQAAGDASLLFDTGPAAIDHLDQIAHLRPESLGITEAGFLRLRLWL